MTALTEQLERLSHRGDHVVVDRAIDAIFADAATSRQRAARRPGAATIALGVAASTVTAVGLAAIASRDDDSSPRASDIASRPVESTHADGTRSPELEPVATLDEERVVAEVPATVVASGPTDWYELQPDLDVAWHSRGTNSWLCFRTPAGEECQLDDFAPAEYGGDGPILVGTGGGQTLVVTMEVGDEITLTLDDGATLSAAVVPDSQIGWGVARVELPEGSTVDDITATYLLDEGGSTSTSVGDTEPDSAPPTTRR